jgi:flagellar assembly protein FliH
MSAAAPQKFTFDLDLGGRRERNSVVTDTAMASLLAKARDDGFREGQAQGERTDATKSALRIAAAAEQLAAHTASMSAALDDRSRQNLAEAVELAATVGRKLAGHLLSREPTGELEALIAECLASIGGAPHLVIRCAPDLADAIREIATARMQVSGFAGRLVVLGDPEQKPGDGRIEWVDGGLVRDRSGIESEIDNRIAAFLAAKGTVPTRAATSPAEEIDQ